MKTKDNLLEKYYRGETTEEEEILLKSEILTSDLKTVEKDIFRFFSYESTVPDGLEESVFESIREKERKTKYRHIWIYSFT